MLPCFLKRAGCQVDGARAACKLDCCERYTAYSSGQECSTPIIGEYAQLGCAIDLLSLTPACKLWRPHFMSHSLQIA